LFTNGGSSGIPHSGGIVSTSGGAGSGGTLNAGTGGGGSATGGSAGSTAGTASATGGAGTTGGVAGAGSAGTGGSLATTGGSGGQVATLNHELKIASPVDDCTWINGTEERLRFSDTQQVLEVGTDAEMGRIGLRFVLPIPQGSRVLSAILRIYRVAGDAAETGTLAIQVFEGATVPPFDATHRHEPAGHVAGGLWAIKASGMLVGRANQFTQSPDLSPLVQHVLDRPDWVPGAAIGFVLIPETMTSWASYADSSSGSGMAATLRLSYMPR
jgi:hypothetical protein